VPDSPLIRAWAIIPARGGSIGVPRKNLQPVRGRSLIARAIDAAKAAAMIEQVFVSTEDAEIAAAAVRAGAEIIERPADLAGDTSASEDVLLHALRVLEHRGETLPDVLAFVQCTSPFVTPGDIDGTIAALLEAGADSAFTVARSHSFLWSRRPDGRVEALNHDASVRLRRQDRAVEYTETGAVYAMRVPGFRAAKHRFFGRTTCWEVPALRALQVDTPDDLLVARATASLLDRWGPASFLTTDLRAVIFDFDGVMTDNRVVQDQSGSEAVICSRSDGRGIEMLRDAGIQMAVISKETNPVVAARCRKLGLPYHQGIDDKASALRSVAADARVELAQVAFVGNDIDDLECLRIAGLGVAVADAHPQVRGEAGLVLVSEGGRGAIRELAEYLLAQRRSSRT